MFSFKTSRRNQLKVGFEGEYHDVISSFFLSITFHFYYYDFQDYFLLNFYEDNIKRTSLLCFYPQCSTKFQFAPYLNFPSFTHRLVQAMEKKLKSSNSEVTKSWISCLCCKKAEIITLLSFLETAYGTKFIGEAINRKTKAENDRQVRNGFFCRIVFYFSWINSNQRSGFTAIESHNLVSWSYLNYCSDLLHR